MTDTRGNVFVEQKVLKETSVTGRWCFFFETLLRVSFCRDIAIVVQKGILSKLF